jgi:hypothetical protein
MEMPSDMRSTAQALAAMLPEDFNESGEVLRLVNELRYWRAGKPIPPAPVDDGNNGDNP